MKNYYKKLYILALLAVLSLNLFAQNEMEYRVSGSVRFSPVKKIKLYVSPELRLDESGLDKFLVETEVKYSALKILDVGASYKLLMNFKTNNPTEYVHQFTFFSQVEHKIDRFNPSLRVMFVNYDEDEGTSNLLRYKTKLEYDIPKIKIDPYIAAELYHEISTGEISKMRYSIGADWRFTNRQSLGLSYKLDDYLDADKKKHIVSLDYSYKF